MSASLKNPEIDELLGKVWSKHANILPELDFLNSVFSFFNRRTAYLGEPGNAKKVVQLVNKFIDEAKELKLKKEQEREREKQLEKERQQEQETKQKEKEKEKENQPQQTTQTETDKYTENKIENNQTSSTATNTNENASSTSTQTSNTEEKKTDAEKDKSNLKDPINNGGITDKYAWTQSLHELDIRIPIPEKFKGKDLKVEIEKRKLYVGIKGKPPIVNGELHDAVLAEECSWTLDREIGRSDKVLIVTMKKENGMTWWKRAMIGDPEIDTSKIEPESSNLQDLDPETKQTVEKMMLEQRQKMMGIPTQKEIEHQQMMAKLKEQFPGMDFSQTKFA